MVVVRAIDSENIIRAQLYHWLSVLEARHAPYRRDDIAQSSPILLVATHLDQNPSCALNVDLLLAELQKHFRHLYIVCFLKLSAFQPPYLKEFAMHIKETATALAASRDGRVPAIYEKVKQSIRQLQHKHSLTVPVDEFMRHAATLGDKAHPDLIRRAIHFLHQEGELVHVAECKELQDVIFTGPKRVTSLLAQFVFPKGQSTVEVMGVGLPMRNGVITLQSLSAVDFGEISQE